MTGRLYDKVAPCDRSPSRERLSALSCENAKRTYWNFCKRIFSDCAGSHRRSRKIISKARPLPTCQYPGGPIGTGVAHRDPTN